MKGSIMEKTKKYISVFLCIVLLITGIGFNSLNLSVFAADPTHIGVVDSSKVSSNLRVRSGPGTSYSALGAIDPGTSVTIYEETNGWYKIGYGSGYGYVSKDYITSIQEIPKYDYDADFETNLTNQKFPESYKVLLRKIHAAHPNWIFMADHLSMTWKEAIDAESKVGHSLVAGSSKASWKSMMQYAYDWDKGKYVSYDSGGWYTAEREVVEYYMEPRNFLNENYIYMFLDQTYNSKIQTKEGLQLILNGTFMEGEFPEDTYDTYADVIMAAAQQSGVSPYVLAASIIIEQGVNGTGGSISGNIKGYEGYYNFFNINAYKSGNYDAVQYGLLYAKGGSDGTGTSLGRPWDTRAKSIIGGAQHYANNFVKRGQDNLYYKKFNVITPSFYVNQYMTNVQGAYLETSKLKNAYVSVGTDAALTFSIPVFKELPPTNTTALPTSSGANNYYLNSIKIDGKDVEDFSRYTNSYELMVESSVSSIKVEATVPSGAKVTGTGAVSLKQGKNTVTLTVTSASGKTAKYILSIFREEGEVPEAIPEPTVTTKYTISTYVRGVEIGTDVKTFLQKFTVKNGTAKITDSANTVKTAGVIATGDKVTVYDNEGTKKQQYNIVVFGDTNSDGKVSIVDLARVQKHLLEVNKLTGNQNSAADVNHDGKISILDLARVQKHLLEISEITQ